MTGPRTAPDVGGGVPPIRPDALADQPEGDGTISQRLPLAHASLGTPGENRGMDMRLELVPVPVADIDRAKSFYVDQVGFVADHDVTVDENVRFVQLTPPGSACSIVLDRNLTDMPPGAQRGLQVVVEDADGVRSQLVAAGVEASEVEEFPWGRFTYFSDPDGNTWACQQIIRPE